MGDKLKKDEEESDGLNGMENKIIELGTKSIRFFHEDKLTYDNLKTWAIRARIAGYLPQLFNRRQMKILVVDAIPLTIMLEKKILQGMGFKNIFEAQNWDSAIEIIRREKPDLITTSIEYYYGVVDFKETIRKIRETNKTVTIIAISSMNSTDIEKLVGMGIRRIPRDPHNNRRTNWDCREISYLPEG